MKFWIILVVLLNIKLSIAYVYCDSRAILRQRTYDELQTCLGNDNYNQYNDYNDYNDDYGLKNNQLVNCQLHIPDFSESTTCTAYRLETNDSLNIEGPNLKRIKFKNSRIPTIPSNFFITHPSLQDIYLNHCHINDIDMNAFDGLENLQTLFLEHNDIVEIKKGIFNSLKNLTILDISCNQIRIIEETSFQGFDRLHNLNISHNNIQNISKGIFESNMSSLHILDLSHNNISTVELQAISNLFHVDLVHDKFIISKSLLDLSFNKLKFFNFSQLYIEIGELNLDNNNLETVDGLTNSKIINILKLSNNHLSNFSYLPESIKFLNLSNNILQYLNISSSNIKLHTLDVSYNLIEIMLPNTFENMTALSKLYIKYNKLIALPIGLFRNLKNLQILSLSGNRLKNFEFGTFSGLSNLLGLDISENLFNSLDYKTFHVLSKLTVLNIAHNGLITLNPYDILNYCKNLQTVMVDNNPWNCESFLNFTTVLQNHHVQVMEGSNSHVQNHLGHACYLSDETTENPSLTVTIDSHQLEKEINDLKKLFEFTFRNSTLYDFFQNYKNLTVQSQKNFTALDDYFNEGFENSSFYRNLNQNISKAWQKPKNYDESLYNLTDTLNLLNLKLSKISQSNLINSALLNASQVNLKNYNEVLSNFSDSFDSKLKSSNFYKFFNKNYAKNALNKSMVDVLNTNLEKFSKSVDDISNYFKNQSSGYKLLQEKLENGSLNQVFLNRVPEALTSNFSKEEFASILDRNQDTTAAQQIASLRVSFITFMVILIMILLIAMLFPILKKFGNFFTKKSKSIDTGKSTTGLSLRVIDDIMQEDL